MMAYDLEQGGYLECYSKCARTYLVAFLIRLIWGLFEPVEEEKLRQAEAADDMET